MVGISPYFSFKGNSVENLAGGGSVIMPLEKTYRAEEFGMVDA